MIRFDHEGQSFAIYRSSKHEYVATAVHNPRDSITIIYAPTSSIPTVTKMGEITSDLSEFWPLPANVDMRIELR